MTRLKATIHKIRKIVVDFDVKGLKQLPEVWCYNGDDRGLEEGGGLFLGSCHCADDGVNFRGGIGTLRIRAAASYRR